MNHKGSKNYWLRIKYEWKRHAPDLIEILHFRTWGMAYGFWVCPGLLSSLLSAAVTKAITKIGGGGGLTWFTLQFTICLWGLIRQKLKGIEEMEAKATKEYCWQVGLLFMACLTFWVGRPPQNCCCPQRAVPSISLINQENLPQTFPQVDLAETIH